jgi:hypothetical protein
MAVAYNYPLTLPGANPPGELLIALYNLASGALRNPAGTTARSMPSAEAGVQQFLYPDLPPHSGEVTASGGDNNLRPKPFQRSWSTSCR